MRNTGAPKRNATKYLAAAAHSKTLWGVIESRQYIADKRYGTQGPASEVRRIDPITGEFIPQAQQREGG